MEGKLKNYLRFLIFMLLFFWFKIDLLSFEFLDSYNRKVILDKKPKKILALGPGALRLVSYLDGIDMLCGVENIEIKFPKRRAYSVAYYEKIKNLYVVGEGGADKKPDYERIIKADPDVIIISSLGIDVVKEIEEKTGKKVFIANYGTIGSFDVERFKDTIKKLGRLIGKEKRGDEIIKKVDGYILDLKKRVKNKNQTKRIYVGGLGFKGAHGIVSTQYEYEPFKILGVKAVIDNISEKEKTDMKHIFIDKETLLLLNPEIVFIDVGGIDIIEKDIAENQVYYKSISAFKNNDVYTTLPFNYYTTNIEVVFINSYFIGSILFPEGFKDINIIKKCSEIMKDFLKKDVCEYFMDNKIFFKRMVLKNGNIVYKEI